MQYTITSRGRPIGVTDLGFPSVAGPDRIGWFLPNTDGEHLMPVVTSAAATSREYVSRRAQLGESSAETEHRETALLADIAEASQHVEALDLELRREDGSVVATEYIVIQDVEELIAWADKEEAVREREDWRRGETAPDPLYDPMEDLFEDELDGLDEMDPAFDPETEEEIIFGDGFANECAPWTSEEYEPDPSMRYQIYVALAEPSAIP